MPVHPKPPSAKGSRVAKRGHQAPLRDSVACYMASEETSGPREPSNPTWVSFEHSHLRQPRLEPGATESASVSWRRDAKSHKCCPVHLEN